MLYLPRVCCFEQLSMVFSLQGHLIHVQWYILTEVVEDWLTCGLLDWFLLRWGSLRLWFALLGYLADNFFLRLNLLALLLILPLLFIFGNLHNLLLMLGCSELLLAQLLFHLAKLLYQLPSFLLLTYFSISLTLLLVILRRLRPWAAARHTARWRRIISFFIAALSCAIRFLIFSWLLFLWCIFHWFLFLFYFLIAWLFLRHHRRCLQLFLLPANFFRGWSLYHIFIFLCGRTLHDFKSRLDRSWGDRLRLFNYDWLLGRLTHTHVLEDHV